MGSLLMIRPVGPTYTTRSPDPWRSGRRAAVIALLGAAPLDSRAMASAAAADACRWSWARACCSAYCRTRPKVIKAVPATESAAVRPSAEARRPQRLRPLTKGASGFCLVANAAERFDDAGGVAELGPQRSDMGVDRAGVHGLDIAPDPFEEAVSGEHDAAVSDQEGQQVELLGRQFHRAIPGPRLSPGRVDDDGPERQDGVVTLGLAGTTRLLGAAQDRLDPGHQLPWAEGFGDVVVGPKLETDDPVDLGVAGGQHDDGYPAAGPQAAADLEAVDAGKHEVEDHERRVQPVGLVQRLRPIGDPGNGEPLVAQIQLQQRGDVVLVFDDQDRLPSRNASHASDDRSRRCCIRPR